MKCLGTLLLVIFSAFFALDARALTLQEINATPNLTPDSLMRLFADFEFKFHEEVQDPETFLKTMSGDCDDFATLAADVLSRRGYTPRLVAVRMKGETHVVCYIVETKTYLDYNFRKESKPTIASSGELVDLARKVSATFNRDWIATYEFTYSQKVKRLVDKIMTNRSAAKTS